MLKRWFCWVTVAALSVLAASGIHAQSLARIDGIVTDQTKAIVVGAKVTIRNMDTGLITSQVSDSAGQYVFPSVLPGTYKLTAQLSGFKTYTRTVIVHANDHLTADVPMTVGDISTSVTVTASTEQMDSGQRSETLTSEQIQSVFP